MALLDAVMDGLTNEDSGALRDLCAAQVSFHHGSNSGFLCRHGASFALSTNLPFFCKHLLIWMHSVTSPCSTDACMFCVTR